jgi:hypothetical protein
MTDVRRTNIAAVADIDHQWHQIDSEDMRNANLSQSSSTARLQPTEGYVGYLTWLRTLNRYFITLNDMIAVQASEDDSTVATCIQYASTTLKLDCYRVGVWFNTQWHIDDIITVLTSIIINYPRPRLVATMTDYVPIPSTALPRGRIFSGVQRVLTTFYRMCWVYCKASNL